MLSLCKLFEQGIFLSAASSTFNHVIQRNMTLLQDSLLTRFREGHFDAFEELFNTYWDALYQYALRILGSEEDAQDLIQDLFVELWERREYLEISTHIRIYLFSATRKKILRKFRDDGLKQKHLEKFILHGELRSELTLNTLIHKDILSQLQEDLQTLPAKEKEVFESYYFEELSIREIAVRNGTAEQTVRNQLSNAHRKALPIIHKLLMLI